MGTCILSKKIWVFFRAASFTDACTVLGAMFGQSVTFAAVVHFSLYEMGIVGVSALLVAVEPLLVTTLQRHGILWWWRVPFWLRGVAYALLTLMVVAFGGVTQKFVYFDF